MRRIRLTAYMLFFLVCAVLLPACGEIAPAIPEGMSPEETVRYYFERMDQKDRPGMDAVVAEDQRGADAELEHLVSVSLIGCEEETDADGLGFNESWCAGEPYDIAKVRDRFDIEYENGGGGGFDNGQYDWSFWLVKENADANWMIVMWGC